MNKTMLTMEEYVEVQAKHASRLYLDMIMTKHAREVVPEGLQALADLTDEMIESLEVRALEATYALYLSGIPQDDIARLMAKYATEKLGDAVDSEALEEAIKSAGIGHLYDEEDTDEAESPNKGEYTLLDGVQQNKNRPDTFKIPSDIDKAKLGVGDYVKLGFIENGTENSEKMWVQITSVKNGKYFGELNNVPDTITAVQFDDVVGFEKKHILGVMK
jgi:uncharacterized protein YegJ (DUF2314 family)